ncbi:MAG: hypothetical protein QOI74_1404 [Micromonosporaceae bacterium]|nr:hypothetical protein [Micromonosporaceae bacterium]
MVDSRVVWVGQPWVAVCAATAIRVGRSPSSQARAVSGLLRAGVGGPGGGEAGSAVGLGRVQGVHGGRSGGEVVVEQAGQGGAALGRGVFVGGPAGGVGADQVMERVPVGGAGLEQVIPMQVVQAGPGGGQVAAGQRRRGVGVEVLAGVQRRQA